MACTTETALLPTLEGRSGIWAAHRHETGQRRRDRDLGALNVLSYIHTDVPSMLEGFRGRSVRHLSTIAIFFTPHLHPKHLPLLTFETPGDVSRARMEGCTADWTSRETHTRDYCSAKIAFRVSSGNGFVSYFVSQTNGFQYTAYQDGGIIALVLTLIHGRCGCFGVLGSNSPTARCGPWIVHQRRSRHQPGTTSWGARHRFIQHP